MGDPAADALLQLLSERGFADADASLVRLHRNAEPLPERTPAPLRAFLTKNVPPGWAEPARLRRGQAFFERNALAITTALFCVALPMAFAGAKGAAVLDVTRRLRTDVDRRVNETGRFVFDVLTPGAFERQGNAVRSAQKVRLMHAAVRRLGRAAGHDDPEDVPINQEDLVGTLLCFSVVVLDALEEMHVTVSRADAEDYFHVWRVVGSLLGIRPRHIPHDVAQAREVARTIRDRQLAPSRHGRELARVLLEGVERHLPLGGLGIAPGLMRYLLGDDIGDMLALPRGVGASDIAQVLRLRRKSDARPATGGGLQRIVLERIIDAKLIGQPPSYHAPLAMLRRAGARRPPGSPASACPRRSHEGTSPMKRLVPRLLERHP